MAGLIDGEGTIGLARCMRGQDHRLIGYEPYIKIVNTNKKVIDWCLGRFGGHMGLARRHKAHRKQLWSWEVNGLGRTKWLLDLVGSFLIVKKRHAAIIQAYWKTGDYRGGSQKPSGRQRVPEEVIAARQKLADRLRFINGGPRPWGRTNSFRNPQHRLLL